MYSAAVLGLGVILSVISRFSAAFSEWYAVTVYPVIIGTVGRVFAIFPFSVAEILIILLLAAVLAGIIALVVILIKNKGNRKPILIKAGAFSSCVLTTAFLIFVTNCGINYNRHTFLHGQIAPEILENEKSARTYEDEWRVFLAILDEFYSDFHDLQNQITTDENGAFKLTVDLKEVVPAAMRKLCEENPRLKSSLYIPPPKPLLMSGLSSDAFLLGFFSPFTIESNYNNIAPDGEKAVSALHESAHVAGFMREEEANFISFLAAKQSGEPELVYAAYLLIFSEMSRLDMAFEMTDEFYALLPRQIISDITAKNNFWRERRWNTTYVYDENGEIIDTVVSENAFVEVISDSSSSINDAYLKLQGQKDGVESYAKMIDLVMAVYSVV